MKALSFISLLIIMFGSASSLLLADDTQGIPYDSPASHLEYDDVFEPVFVARPLSDAYIGLSKLEDGEIRYYDYGEQSQLAVEELREEMRPAKNWIYSRDNGLTWFKKKAPEGFVGADVRSPISGEYLRILIDRDQVVSIRSEGGIDGKWKKSLIGSEKYHMFAPPIFIREGKRVLVPCHWLFPTHSYGLYLSDDDGLSWRFVEVEAVPNHEPGGVHKGPRWQNPGIEPHIVELSDGRLWMIIRTSQDNHYESYSYDGGESWTTPEPSRFYGTITMPRVYRLQDGRLLLVWNNTTPFPELAMDHPMKKDLPLTSKDGTWEDVFTNRAAIHAAISEDDGKTWVGFRELYLDPRRNATDYTGSGGVDHSVHQNQMVELEDGKVLVAIGQHPLHRALILFDPDWLYEKTRKSDFKNGLENWTTHNLIAEIKGHCSFNRKPGSILIQHPEDEEQKVLKISRPDDPSLLSQSSGAVWNFPAGQRGSLTTRVMLPEGSKGARINLSDRWFNASDTTATLFSIYSLDLNTESFEANKWHQLRFEWDGLQNSDSGSDQQCKLFVDDVSEPVLLSLNRESVNGISYIHFISTAEAEDLQGMLVESVSVTVE